MLELVLYYILPNVVLFGGLYLLAKYVEKSTWYFIENYDSIQKQLDDLRLQFKIK